MSETDVFILSAVSGPTPQAAIEAALAQAGLTAAHLDDIFWAGDVSTLDFPAVQMSRKNASLQQALHSAAQIILSESAQVVLAGGDWEDGSTVWALCAPAPVGRLNLDPLMRIAAQAQAANAVERVLDAAEVSADNIQVYAEAQDGISLLEMMAAMNQNGARLGLYRSALPAQREMAIILERL